MKKTHKTISLRINVDDDTGWLFELDNEKNNNKTVFRAGEEVYLRVRHPKHSNATIVSSVGSCRRLNETSESTTYQTISIPSKSNMRYSRTATLMKPADKFIGVLNFQSGPKGASNGWEDFGQYFNKLSDVKIALKQSFEDQPVVFGIAYKTYYESWVFTVPGFCYFQKDFLSFTKSLSPDIKTSEILYTIVLELKEV